ncbi:DUF1127 domain-containing protein [Mesorhizobium atlanticum]
MRSDRAAMQAMPDHLLKDMGIARSEIDYYTSMRYMPRPAPKGWTSATSDDRPCLSRPSHRQAPGASPRPGLLRFRACRSEGGPCRLKRYVQHLFHATRIKNSTLASTLVHTLHRQTRRRHGNQAANNLWR